MPERVAYTRPFRIAVTRLRQLLVVAELAVSLVLLIGAGLLARSFLKLASADLGFPAAYVTGAGIANTFLGIPDNGPGNE